MLLFKIKLVCFSRKLLNQFVTGREVSPPDLEQKPVCRWIQKNLFPFRAVAIASIRIDEALDSSKFYSKIKKMLLVQK